MFGITKRGDAALDYSWEDKLNTVDGAIILFLEEYRRCI